MWSYNPPLRDMQFVIEDVLDAPSQWTQMPAFAEVDAGTVRFRLQVEGDPQMLPRVIASGPLLRPQDGGSVTELRYVLVR